MKPIRFLQPAENELIDAALYYESQAEHLGEDFLAKIGSALEDIRANPKQWPVIEGGTRRRLAHRFPYGILYRIDPEEIVVLAVMHLRRDPKYWTSRS